MSFKCAHCGKQVTDANVMVDEAEFSKNQINKLIVVCKPCTNKYDGAKQKPALHNLWELGWFDRFPLHLVGGVLGDLVGGSAGLYKWSPEAVNDFYRLLVAAHPKLSKDPMGIP